MDHHHYEYNINHHKSLLLLIESLRLHMFLKLDFIKYQKKQKQKSIFIECISTRKFRNNQFSKISAKMSSSSSSSNKSFFIESYYSIKIIDRIEAFQKPGQGIMMTVMTANHGYALITLQDDTCVLVEAGYDENKQGMAISFKPVYRQSYARYHRIDFSPVSSHRIRLYQLIDFLKDKYKGTKYDATDNNCYDVVEQIFLYFDRKQQQQKIQKEKNKQINKGIRSVTGTGYGAIGAYMGSIAGPVGTAVGGVAEFVVGKLFGLLVGRKTD